MAVYQKARIFDPDSPTKGFYVQFNPNTLQYSAGREWGTHKNVVKSTGTGKPQAPEPEQQSPPFGSEWGSTLSVRLFFHSYINDSMFSDVRPNVNRIRAFLPVAPGGQKTGSSTKAASPRMTFAWGTVIYTGTLESFHAAYQMFAVDGTPVQAEVTITIRGEDQEVSASSNNRALSAVSNVDFSQQDDTLFLSGVSWLFQ